MQVVTTAVETGRITTVCGNVNLRTTLDDLVEQLELCQKSLSSYLEAKRSDFPRCEAFQLEFVDPMQFAVATPNTTFVSRFNFVSDSTLLEILPLGTDPAAVVPHFQAGLFDGLASVGFAKANPNQIVEMRSAQGECVTLIHDVKAQGRQRCAEVAYAPLSAPFLHCGIP